MLENVAKIASAADYMFFALSDLRAFNVNLYKHNAVLALDSSALDIDQVENLIKFCHTKEEMTMLKNYNGTNDMLGMCEQFFWS
ncbi:hypothetical protein CsSME_00051360 [Camellia sinensis var. sinensis]